MPLEDHFIDACCKITTSTIFHYDIDPLIVFKIFIKSNYIGTLKFMHHFDLSHIPDLHFRFQKSFLQDLNSITYCRPVLLTEINFWKCSLIDELTKFILFLVLVVFLTKVFNKHAWKNHAFNSTSRFKSLCLSRSCNATPLALGI